MCVDKKIKIGGATSYSMRMHVKEFFFQKFKRLFLRRISFPRLFFFFSAIFFFFFFFFFLLVFFLAFVFFVFFIYVDPPQ